MKCQPIPLILLPIALLFTLTWPPLTNAEPNQNICDSVTEIPTAQCTTLVNLYNSTDGDNWTNNTGWLQTNTPCSWYGVTCGNGLVTKIDLHDNNLNGTLPNLSAFTSLEELMLYTPAENSTTPNNLTGNMPDLSALTNLKTLILGGNKLSGPIPESINTLTKLEILSLWGNQLTGTIPELNALTQLRYLGLSQNKLSGPIPKSINTLTKLENLYLWGNQLTGSIPELNALTQLRLLSFSQNELSGPIPNLNTLVNLETLSLSDNQLTGTIPELNTLTQLQYLALNKNKLSGPIPISINTLTKLDKLYLWGNQLTGTIPELNALTQLRNLTLSQNKLSGPIPNLNTLVNLETLNLWGNQLTGTIPESISTLTNLKSLYLATNQLTGTIPDLSALKQLESIAFETNQLSGSIPESIGTLTNLQKLHLGGNQFTGSIPDLSDLNNLEELRLQDNQLTGSIPNFSTLNSLQRLTLSGNTKLCKDPNANYSKWTSTLNSFPYCQANFCDMVTEIPKAQCETLIALYNSTNGENWTNNTGWLRTKTPCSWYGVTCGNNQITNIKLNNNKLNGTLPNFSSLTDLQYLSLYKNQLTGPIPDFSKLISLQILSLYENQFIGPIPDLSKLTNLKYLILSRNKLTGSIPDFSGLTNLQILQLHLNQFTGPIPDFSGLTKLTVLSLYDNQLTGSIPDLSGLTNLRLLYLHNNQLTGSIPNFSELTNLQYLYFNDNQLTGSIPDLSGLTLNKLSVSNNSQLCKNPNTDYGKWTSTVSSLVDCQVNFCDTVAEIPKAQCETLIALYDSTNGDNWLKNTGWKQTNTPCSWQGVSCSGAAVTQINLPHNKLNGTLPNLSGLTNLQELDLDYNQLTGSIPNLSGLSNLQTINLFNNQFSGSIPDFSRLTDLQYLNLGINQFTGSLPNLSGLTNLQTLFLSNNQLTGSIPDLSGLTNLQTLFLSNNQLTGSIPDLSGLTNLKYLELDYNQLTGSIPDLSGLTNLKDLALEDNQLTGLIPDLSGLTNLRTLRLYNNQLTGSIPDLNGLTNLRYLRLHNNQLTGSIPDLSGLTNLQRLNLSKNKLTDFIPDLSGLTNLEDLVLDDNQFTGSIPDFSTLTNLQTLHINGNTGLCKNPNTKYGKWASTVSSFSDCQVSFCDTVTEIPKAQCEVLVALYDSTDGDNWKDNTGWLQTNTPCSWYGITCSSGAVTKIHFDTNKLNGTLPDFSGLTNLQGLYLGRNQLTGSIPNLSELTNLQGISLRENQLIGSIPNFSGLTKLRYLDLYKNQLTGSISDLSQLTSLQTLIIQNNQLTGSIPNFENLTQLRLILLNNNSLCKNSSIDYGDLDVSAFLACDDPNYGVVLHLPFDGNANDASSNGNNGTINGATLTTDRHGNENNAYFFNGENSWIEASDSASLDSPLNAVTLSTWVFVESFPSEGWDSLLSKGMAENAVIIDDQPVQGHRHYSLFISNNQKIHLAHTPNSSQTDFQLPLKEWVHLAVVASSDNGGQDIYYVNGAEVFRKSNIGFSTLRPNDDPLYLGKTFSSRFFHGKIDDVLIYNRALTASEVQSYYDSTKPATTVSGSCTAVTEIPQSECEALITFYDSLGGDNWTNKTGWKQTNTPCNGWYNVACKNGHVSHIHLEENNLVGTIPDLSALTELEALAIGRNAGITGAFPDISQLSKLFHFSVGATNLSGSLPANIVNASQLRELGVGETQLSGDLPDFSQLSNLQVLDLNHCQLSGEIPALPTSLTLLNLAGNNLSGTIPALSGLSNLQTLWLSENKLTGSIPELSSLTQLQQAYFSHNQLTGSMPSLAGLTELVGFSISRNQLTGPIPDLSHLTKLEKLWLDNNDLSGPIPEVSLLTNLQLFTLDGNAKLEGPIPSLPASLTTLTLGGELCRNPNADYAGHTEVNAFGICPDVKFVAEASTVEACIGQNLTVTVKKQLTQTVNQIQLALSYDANLLRVNTISNAGPLRQFNANHANGSATIEAGNFTGVSDEFELATLQLVPLAASVGTALQFEESQTLVKLNGASLRYEAKGVTVAIENCVSDIEVKPEANSSIWTLVNEAEAIEQTGANLDAPKSISFDANGNSYIADSLNHRILKRDTQGQLSVVAGNGKKGFAGDEGPAIEANLNSPQGTAVDEEGNLYMADTNNHRIRKVDSNGIITTVVGSGKKGFAGDESLALKAKLRNPTAIVFDNNGHLYIADSGNHRIRKVSGQRTRKPGAESIITTFAGGGRRSYHGDNGPATQARLNNPAGLAVDSQNNVYIADTDNHRVRKVDNRGIITTVAGTGDNGYSGDGDPAIAAKLNAPTGLEVDSANNLYIADKNNHRVRKVDDQGIITTFTGTGKRGASTDGILAGVAQVDQPSDVAFDQYGNLYIADKGNDTIRKIGEKEGEDPIARPHEIADCANTETTGIPESECYALIALYDSTQGPNWTDNEGWKATDTPCQWTGVTCEAGHVSEINLANNNLVGDMPPQIGALVNLTQLNLNDNQVSGAIPTTIEHLNNLATLNLANNELSGSLPVELSGATGLQTVNLANNQISGEIPELAPLTQLETLDLQNNLLSGEVPDLTVLPALQTLDISNENQQLCKNSETDYSNLVEGLDACPTDNQLPTAAFTTTPNKGEAPLTVQLDARISHDPYGNITAYFWESSDGQILTGATPTITFNKSGTYDIKLRVMDHDGAPSINVAKQLIEVSPASDQATLTLNKDGTGLGTIRLQRDKDPATTCKTDCQTDSQDYPLGSEIKLSATAAKGSLFTGWQGDCVGTEADNKIKVTMDSAKQCTAVFELESPIPSTMHALTIDSVAAEFSSGGSVKVNDLLCETPPCKSYHQRNKNVKITAVPIPHAYFMSWNNDCPVLGTFQDATNLVTLTSDTTCIAYFGNDSIPASEETARQFEEVAELSTGESVSEMYPELENRERYELAFLVAEKAMMTAETQMIIPGEESWPDQFDKVEDFFKLPENLWVKKVRIVSTEEQIGQFHVQGQYVRVDVLLLNKNGREDLVPILIYYKDKPTLEETATPPPPAQGNETRRGTKYRCWWCRPIFFRRPWRWWR